MRHHHQSASLLGLTCLLLGAGMAVGGDGIAVKVTNDTSSSVVVTVIDMNSNPELSIISNETIYGFASRSIRITPDSSGNGHIRWTAISGDAGSRTCGRKERDQLNSETVVHVSANNSCEGN
jgi:hypothetical protein